MLAEQPERAPGRSAGCSAPAGARRRCRSRATSRASRACRLRPAGLGRVERGLERLELDLGHRHDDGLLRLELVVDRRPSSRRSRRRSSAATCRRRRASANRSSAASIVRRWRRCSGRPALAASRSGATGRASTSRSASRLASRTASRARYGGPMPDATSRARRRSSRSASPGPTSRRRSSPTTSSSCSASTSSTIPKFPRVDDARHLSRRPTSTSARSSTSTPAPSWPTTAARTGRTCASPTSPSEALADEVPAVERGVHGALRRRLGRRRSPSATAPRRWPRSSGRRGTTRSSPSSSA